MYLIGVVQGMPLPLILAIAFGILLLCGFGLPIPEDITLVLCGYATFLNVGHSWPHALLAVGVGLLGVLVGDGIMFTLGRRFGKELAVRFPFKQILGNGRLEKTLEYLNQNGAKMLFTARFTPGLRSVVFFTSGHAGIPLKTFLFYDGLAAMLSAPALVLSSWYWGEQIQEVVKKAQRAEHGIAIVILVIAAGLGLHHWLSVRRKKAAATAVERMP
jgi:membrane protein DedA with SNARE-associated domain